MKLMDKTRKIFLGVSNITLIIIVILAAIFYSKHVKNVQEQSKVLDFITTVESMKQVSQNYINSERGYVCDWAEYITQHDMTLAEAMEFLRSINTDKERLAHIVDMDTFEAYSSYYPAGEEKIDTYRKYMGDMTEAEDSFRTTLIAMFNGTEDGFKVLGKYQLDETHARVVSVGKKVRLRTENGHRDFLLLRIIPTDVIKKTWVFPMEYKTAEVGIITREGDYVVQSNSMKSGNFRDYIRAYNFQDDYNKVNDLQARLMDTEQGILTYKNFRGNECLWYYSSFGNDTELDILAMIDVEELKTTIEAWYIIFIVCGTLMILMVIDGVHLYMVNTRLREAVKLANQASEAKTQFLSAMSHDIRTPLNAVIGMTTIAKKNTHNPEYVEECLDKTLSAGKQLLTLINDVLDISKIESGKITFNPENVDLETFMADLMEMQEPMAKEKNISVFCDVDNLPYRYVYVDQLRLNQIFVNLLSNAVKYTDAGGIIKIHLYEKSLEQSDLYTKLVFSVSDNGIGMTEEFQKNMYNLFSREVNTQVNRTQGTGLGLSIVKQIVDLLNGTIECNSIHGEGTTFIVTLKLPIAKQVEKQQVEVKKEKANLNELHLLVAEDNDLNWEIIDVLLSEQGITCDRAENGKVCVEMLKNTPAGTYDGILMDIQMPVMNGLEATRTIRALKDENKNKIPIVAMTADAFAENVQECLECGMNGHVAKPVDMNKLLVYLNRMKA